MAPKKKKLIKKKTKVSEEIKKIKPAKKTIKKTKKESSIKQTKPRPNTCTSCKGVFGKIILWIQKEEKSNFVRLEYALVMNPHIMLVIKEEQVTK